MSQTTSARPSFLRSSTLADAVCWIGFTTAVFGCGFYVGSMVFQVHHQPETCQGPAIHSAS